MLKHSNSLWELFGFRAWSDRDLGEIDADDLLELLEAARQYEKESRRQAAEAKRGR